MAPVSSPYVRWPLHWLLPFFAAATADPDKELIFSFFHCLRPPIRLEPLATCPLWFLAGTYFSYPLPPCLSVAPLFTTIINIKGVRSYYLHLAAGSSTCSLLMSYRSPFFLHRLSVPLNCLLSLHDVSIFVLLFLSSWILRDIKHSRHTPRLVIRIRGTGQHTNSLLWLSFDISLCLPLSASLLRSHISLATYIYTNTATFSQRFYNIQSAAQMTRPAGLEPWLRAHSSPWLCRPLASCWEEASAW